MTAVHQDSLFQLLQALHAERVATWRPEDLQVNIDQRRRLVEGVDAGRFVKVGDVLEPFSVPAVDGSIVELDQLLAGGPVVVIFFRFAGCPACNIALTTSAGCIPLCVNWARRCSRSARKSPTNCWPSGSGTISNSWSLRISTTSWARASAFSTRSMNRPRPRPSHAAAPSGT